MPFILYYWMNKTPDTLTSFDLLNLMDPVIGLNIVTVLGGGGVVMYPAKIKVIFPFELSLS